MSQTSVLFDVAGPRTRARHRIYTIISLVVILGLAALLVLRMADRGQFAYDLWEPFLTPDYIRALLVDGLLKTLQMAFFSVILAVVFGTIFGVGKLSDHASVRWVCWSVVEFFRAVPVLMLMIFLYFAYGAGPGGLDAFWCVVIALTLYNGSVLAEVFRAGILAVPRGQSEAAYAIGMRKTQVMTQILLPQAVKIMLPAIISQCVVALKDTSLGYAITAPGLTFVGKQIYTDFQNQLQTVIVIAALYVVRQPGPDLDRHLGAEEVRRREEDPRGVDGGGDRRGDGAGAGRALSNRWSRRAVKARHETSDRTAARSPGFVTGASAPSSTSARRQVLHQELDGGGVRVDPVGALGEAVTLVVVHPQLAVDALAVEGGLDLPGLRQRDARVVGAVDHEQRRDHVVEVGERRGLRRGSRGGGRGSRTRARGRPAGSAEVFSRNVTSDEIPTMSTPAAHRSGCMATPASTM